MAFRFIELFAGIGGIRYALEPLGGQCVFASEIDKHARKAYAVNHGHAPSGDITKIASTDIPDHDILTGGFPCQSFSGANYFRRGLDDMRGNLFFDVARILRDKKPAAFILENVRGLLSHDNGRTMEIILAGLNEAGYYADYEVLSGLDYGVPQKRERVIFVGFRDYRFFQWPARIRMKTLSEILEPDDQIDPRRWLKNSGMNIKNVQQFMSAFDPSRVKIPRPFILNMGHSRPDLAIRDHAHTLTNLDCRWRRLVNGERELTGRELLRMQGFPESYQIAVSAHQHRCQIGNALVVPKIQAVAKNVIAAL